MLEWKTVSNTSEDSNCDELIRILFTGTRLVIMILTIHFLWRTQKCINVLLTKLDIVIVLWSSAIRKHVTIKHCFLLFFYYFFLLLVTTIQSDISNFWKRKHLDTSKHKAPHVLEFDYHLLLISQLIIFATNCSGLVKALDVLVSKKNLYSTKLFRKPLGLKI